MRSTLSALPAVLLVACSAVSAPEEARVLGEIAGYAAGDPHVAAERGAAADRASRVK